MAVSSLSRRLALLAVLSLTDLLLTWYLLSCRGGAYESNPAAAWFLEQFGWLGLAAFKLAMVALVVVLIVAVARRSPRAAGRLTAFSCAILVIVVAYSSLLIPGVRAQDAHVKQIDERSQNLEIRCQHNQIYRATFDRLVNELAARERSLLAAVETLEGLELVRQPYWGRLMNRNFPGCTLQEALALRLIEETLESVNRGADSSAELAADLHSQFQGAFGRPVPVPGPNGEGKDGASLSI